MPKHTKAPPKPTQAKNADLRKRFKKQTEEQKIMAQYRRLQASERDQILKAALKSIRGKGIYEPKSLKLTKYRRAKANKVLKEYGDFLNSKKYFFVNPNKKQQAQFNERARSLNMKTTKTGVFIAKEGHTKAKVKYDAKRQELFIERSGKTKRGPRKGVNYRTITPLTDIDTLSGERNRIRNLASKFGKLEGNDRVTFKVIENGVEGYSQKVFSSIELLLDYLDSYKKSVQGKVQFFRHIIIEKTTAQDHLAFIKQRLSDKAANDNRKASRFKKLGE